MQNAKRRVQNLKNEKMKKYVNPEIEIVKIDERDVITTSPGTFGPTVEEEFESWKISIDL